MSCLHEPKGQDIDGMLARDTEEELWACGLVN